MVRIGVIGAGQLARMMIPPAVELGLDIKVLAEAEHMSASLAATQVGDYRDVETVLAFAETVDVITFDHEHVPQPVLRALVDAGHAVHPGPDALAVAQDKLVMRTTIANLGIDGPDFAEVADADALRSFIDAHGGVAVLKTRRGGYDGKGVRVVRDAADAADWFEAAVAAETTLLAEEFVPFTRELAQLVARRPSGEVRTWPLVESLQKDGVCVEVYAPAPGASVEAIEHAGRIAETIASELGVTGVLAVEMFETVDGRMLVNELAMRPHNSGHFSIDASLTSQFEQHLRAVADLPLGDTAPRAKAATMVNILGGPEGADFTSRYPELLAAYPSIKVHSYDKLSRPGRKVGHVTALGEEIAETIERARGAARYLD